MANKKHAMKLFHLPGAIAVSALTVAATSNANDLQTQTVVLSGYSPDGTDTYYEQYIRRGVKINDSGTIAFIAWARNPLSTSSIDSLWVREDGNLELISDYWSPPAWADANTTLFRISNLTLNQAGHYSFTAELRDAISSGSSTVDFSNSASVWSNSGAGVEKVLRESETPPAISNYVFSNSGRPTLTALDGSGSTAVRFGLLNTTNQTIDGSNGIWSYSDKTLSNSYLSGQAAPGIPGEPLGTGGSGVFQDFDYISLDDSGRLTVKARLTGYGNALPNGGTAPSPTPQGIWQERNGALDLLIREGDQVAGQSAGVVYTNIQGVSANNSGDFVFQSYIEGPGVGRALNNHTGWWFNDGNQTQSIMTQSGSAPGTNASFDSAIRSNVILNKQGKALMHAVLAGEGVSESNDEGFWLFDNGNLNLLLRENDFAPGTENNARFSDFTSSTFNATGQFAFRSKLAGHDIDSTNDEGIWATLPDGTLTLVARKGQEIDVNDDPRIEDVRTISAVHVGEYVNKNAATSYRGEHYTPVNDFNSSGQLVYQLRFTDGSDGIFVTSVPEPASITFLLIGCITLARRRHRTEFHA